MILNRPPALHKESGSQRSADFEFNDSVGSSEGGLRSGDQSSPIQLKALRGHHKEINVLFWAQQRNPHRTTGSKAHHAIVVVDVLLSFVVVERPKVDGQDISLAVEIGSHQFLLS